MLSMNSGGEIYHSYYQTPSGKSQERVDNRFSRFLRKASIITAIAGFTLVFIQFAPSIWFGLTKGVDKLAVAIGSIGKPTKAPIIVKDDYLPRYDPSLPRENRIKITKIGVDTPIIETTVENYEVALKKGVWRVPDFGTPEFREYPTIVAAHRFGYLAWTNTYRRKNSFFNLPKLKEGDTVEVIWKQRKYLYEIYKLDKGEQISDYTANLILYTCETLDSSQKIFRYARLLRI
jgi:hypothetical protein